MANKDSFKSPTYIMKSLYAVVGAAVGAVEGFSSVAKRTVTKQAVTYRDIIGHQAAEAVKQAYIATGSLAGIGAGCEYGLLCFWWWISDDEIKAKLLKGSPVKYQLHEKDFNNRPYMHILPNGDVEFRSASTDVNNNVGILDQTSTPNRDSHSSSSAPSQPSSRPGSCDLSASQYHAHNAKYIQEHWDVDSNSPRVLT